MAAALVAGGAVRAGEATTRAKVLRVGFGGRSELALVDVCVTTVTYTGARALWQVDALEELYCAFAEPHAVGLSGVAALLRPTPRDHPTGVTVRLAGGRPASQTVLAPVAPVAPGVLARVGALGVSDLVPGEPHHSRVRAGTVALDGERELEFGPSDQVTVTLSQQGPRVVELPAVLRAAADRGLLVAERELTSGPNSGSSSRRYPAQQVSSRGGNEVQDRITRESHASNSSSTTSTPISTTGTTR